MSDDQAERIAGLEQRVRELEAEQAVYRARFDALEQRVEARLMPTKVRELTGDQLEMTMKELFERLSEHTARAVKPYNDMIDHLQVLVADMVNVKSRQDAAEHTLQALQQQSRSAESLLTEYESKVKPTGKTMRAWLKEIGAPDRYQAVVTFRSRRRAKR